MIPLSLEELEFLRTRLALVWEIRDLPRPLLNAYYSLADIVESVHAIQVRDLPDGKPLPPAKAARALQEKEKEQQAAAQPHFRVQAKKRD